MSAVQVTVEFNYMDLKQMWNRNHFACLFDMKCFLVCVIYIASALLLNFIKCVERGANIFLLCNVSSFGKTYSL